MSNRTTPLVRRSAAAAAMAAVMAAALAACTSAGASPSAAPPTPAASAAPTAASATAPAMSGASPGASASASVDLKAEVDATSAGLDQALALYRGGNVQGALDTVAESYEEHFERIEAALEDVNKELKEDLESLIATKIRQAMTANQPATAVEALVTEAKTKLATARGLLP